MFRKKNLKQNFQDFLIKKIFSETYYAKYYIRNNFLDASDYLYNFKKTNKHGFSLYSTIYTYSHINNNKFTFNSFLVRRNLNSKFFLKNFYNNLVTLTNKKSFFILLKPKVGGFSCYFSGFIGSLPKNNIIFLKKIVFLGGRSILLFDLIYNLIKINKFLKCFRFYIQIIKIKIKLFCKRNNFSSVKKSFLRKLSIITTFLFKKKMFK